VVGAGAVGPGFCRGRRASLLDGRSADALRRDGSVAWWATSSLPISRAGSTPAGAEGAEGATSQKGGASLKSPPPCSCMPAHRPPGVVGSTHSGVRVGRRPWVVVVVTTWYRARSNGKGGPKPCPSVRRPRLPFSNQYGDRRFVARQGCGAGVPTTSGAEAAERGGSRSGEAGVRLLVDVYARAVAADAPDVPSPASLPSRRGSWSPARSVARRSHCATVARCWFPPTCRR
jgi:hypothetical protein